MSPHQWGYYALLNAQNGGMKIRDPADAGTFHIDKSFGVCEITIAAGTGETRVLPSATSGNGIGVGAVLYVVVDTVGSSGYCTISDDNSVTVQLDTAGQVATFRCIEIGGTKKWIGSLGTSGVTASAAELNVLDGMTATTTELNAAADASARILSSTATQVALGSATHAGRILLLQGTANSTYTYTLPAATGSGETYTLIIGGATTTVTQGTHIITVTGNDTFRGVVNGFHTTTTGGGVAWTTLGGTTITLNHTTQGGIYGDTFRFIDVATDVFVLTGTTSGSGTLATPIT